MRLAGCLLGVALLVTSAITTQGATRIAPLDSLTDQDLPRVELTTSDAQGVSLEFILPAITMEPVPARGEVFQQIEIPGGEIAGQPGDPGLPSYTRLIAVPDDAAVTVTVEVDGVTEISDVLVMPAQLDEEEFSYSEDAYSADRLGPASLADAGSPALLRNMRVVALTFNPVQYNPATRTLRVTERMRVDIRFEGTDERNVRRARHTSIPPSFDRLYQSLILNYRGPDPDQRVESGTWLAICPNSSAITSRLEPLVEWRRRKGLPVYVATTAETGTTTSSIKNFIQNAYDNWEIPPEYVVLVGDATGSYAIPTWTESYSGYYGEGDLPYAQLEGGDPLPDVHYGRLSIQNTTHLDVIVDKIVRYESQPYMDDTSWFTRACLTGDPSTSGQSCVIVMQWLKTRLLEVGYTDVDTIFNGNFPTQMLAALNQGDTIFAYRGYYHMSGWTNTHAYQMTNTHKTPFGIFSTCDTGSFENDNECRAEAFLRVGSVGSPRGFVGAAGTATIGTHTRHNNCYTYGVFHGLLYEDMYEMGAAINRGRLELYLNYYEHSSSYANRFMHWNNLMGDPAAEVWTAVPSAMVVNHDETVALGANAMVVTVEEEAGGPCPGAKVCLWKGDETFIVGLTDEQGICELPISPETGGEMLVTVTRHNCQPYLSSVQVVSPGVYVGYNAHLIDDDGDDDSQGNGDGVVNPGEEIELRVQLRNFGTITASGVVATLTCSDPYVTITDAQESYGTIHGGSSAWPLDDFDFVLDPACPHGRLLEFGLDVTSGANQWHSMVEIPVTAAEFTANGQTLYNAGGNGILDPGETVELSVRLRNTGGADAQSVQAQLISDSPWISVLDGQASYGAIPVGAQVENTSDHFTLSADLETFQGHLAVFRLVTTCNGGVADTAHVSLSVGQASSDDPIGPDGYGYFAFDNTDTAYPQAPTYNWIEIDPGYGGDGTEVVLGDYDKHQDASRTVDLPFNFQYYGKSFSQATICSNGWIAMGSTYLTSYRNWSIPGAGSPPNMIAAFWDDLYQSGGAKVWQKYDQANHRWIVEWSRMLNHVGYNNVETFQAILYDPLYHPTETGDGIIEFQYHTVNNVDSTDMYSTVGIQNEDCSDGLLYTYWNDYPIGAAPLAAGRAIRFMPIATVVSGRLEGLVVNASFGNAPIEGAEVAILNADRVLVSAPDGSYGGNVPVGTYSVVASAVGFQPDTLHNVLIEQDQTTAADFGLTDIAGPYFITEQHPSTTDQSGPYPVTTSITDASGVTSVAFYYRVNGGEYMELPLSSQGGDLYQTEIPGQPHGSSLEYYIEAEDGLGQMSLDPPSAPQVPFVFLVANAELYFGDDLESDQGWTVGAPGDNATTGIWVRVDPNGTWNGSDPVQPEDDHTPGAGTMCFVTGNAAPGAGQGDNDVDDGTTTLFSPVIDLRVFGSAILQYYRWYRNDTGSSPHEDVWVVQITDDGQNWITLEDTNVSEGYWKLMEFTLENYIDFTDQVQVRFLASDLGSGSIVEAAVDDFRILLAGVSDVAEGNEAPAFRLAQNRPNPFARSTSIRFSVSEESRVRLQVYDIQGRVVRRLVDGLMGVGPRTVQWDGRTDEGTSAPAGIYFYRLEAGDRREVRKMILVN